MKQPKTQLTIPYRSSNLFLLWVFLNVLIRPGQLCAQVPFESISIQQGLSQGMIFDILQDHEGFVWFGTLDGLNRYDGYNFKVFTHDPYDRHSLSGNSIQRLFEDGQGRIWVLTANTGLNVYDKRKGHFHRLKLEPARQAAAVNSRIRCIAEDASGNILVATDGEALRVITLVPTETAPKIKQVELPANMTITGIIRDRKGRVWIGGSNHCLYQLSTKSLKLYKVLDNFSFTNATANPDGSIWAWDENSSPFYWDGLQATPLFNNLTQTKAIQVSSDGKLWLGHTSGLYGIDLRHWKPGKSLNWQDHPFFAQFNMPLTALAIDRSGMIWVGTQEYGIYKINPQQNKFSHDAKGLGLRRIVPGTDGTVFLGSYANAWYQLKDKVVTPAALKGIQAPLLNLLLRKKGGFWFLTDTAIVGMDDSGKLTSTLPLQGGLFAEKQPMLEDQQGKVWLAGYGGTLTQVNPLTKQLKSFSFAKANPSLQAQSPSTALFQDKNGVIWIGTQEGFGKAVFKQGKPAFTWYRNDPNQRNSLSYNHVTSFLDDPQFPQRYLWIGTRGGLNRLDKKTGDFLHLSTQDGLPNSVIYGLLADQAGQVWGSTNRGLFCLSQLKDRSRNIAYQFRNFSTADGLQNDEFNTGAFAQLADGRLAFGGVNGLNIFDPEAILAGNYQPPVYLTKLLINNQTILPGDESGILTQIIEKTPAISLNHRQDLLTLEFAALDFTASSQNKYQYQLLGADEDWIQAGSSHTATYLHLPPGQYTFRVQGSNSHGVWSPQLAELKIKILPPWWRSWLAYLAYLLLLGLAGRALFRFYLNREKLKAQLSYETREAARIKELDTAKNRLYTNITHEFRTPLTVIMGMAQQTLAKPEENLPYKQEMILRNGQQLLQLVNEMLDLSRLESGKMALHVIQGDAIAFLRYIVESFHSLAESQQKQLHFLSTLHELNCAYDPEKLRQIVSNLLSNALKFTPELGHIYLSIDRRLQNGKPVLQITVKDTGIGIPEQQLPHIFDRFYQVDDSPTRQGEGAGIGLALTRELVGLLQGEIRANSPARGSNKGAEFIVLLPVEVANAATAEDASPDSWAIPLPIGANPQIDPTLLFERASRQLILLVEDNPDVTAYLKSCLPEYQLEFAVDGQEGFDKATALIPDLIISDVMMPRMDGFTLCQHLRDDERSSHIPIVLLTAKADFESKLTGLDRGADVYLEKPFQAEELQLRIKKMLESREKLKQHYLKSAGLARTDEADFATTKAEMKEDAFVKKVRETVETNLADYTFTIEQLCKEIHLSQRQLQRKLEALTGFSPNQFIRQIRLNQAKTLLRDPELSITAVAYDCGFSDPSYFARVFKQEFDMTPLEWREKERRVLNEV